MNNFQEASRIKLMFSSVNGGQVTTYQLWDYKPSVLAEMIKKVHSDMNLESPIEDLDFLESKPESEEYHLNSLRFSILKDIYTIKKEEANAATIAKANKANNRMIQDIIDRKKLSDLESKSIEDLEKMIK